ncbi:MAG: hypothetical protein JRI23_33025 [Deltaproteobacteria bacterium]|jgi:hypothetical protein|nr:hypothetical protein [Deltaproteobacteria bacterium]MBW2537077.1 hypothetical protein [Deltaproteobacteria bacterium]
MPRSRRLSLVLLCALSLMGCKRALEDMKNKESARRQDRKNAQEATIDGAYAALRFLAQAPDPATLQTQACDDPPLREKYKPTARICTRLPTIDHGYLQHLVGARTMSAEQAERWAWMRRGGSEHLAPVGELSETFDRKRAAEAAERIHTGHLGMFTPSPAAAGDEPAQYDGFLVIYDVVAQKPACQVKISFEVGEIFDPPTRRRGHSELQDSPRKHQRAFWLTVNKQLRTITKVFCTNYPS